MIKPKLLIYSESHVLGGADRYLANVLPALSQDWEIIFLYRPDVDFEPLITVLKEHPINCLPEASPGYSFGNIKKLKKLFRKYQPDLIAFNMGHFYAAKGARLAAIFTGIPQILIQHGSPSDGKKHASFLNRLFARFTYQKALGIIVPSQASASFIKKYFPYISEPFVIPHGIDLKIFNPKAYDRNLIRQQLEIPQQAFVLTFIAHMEQNKHPEWVIDIFKNLSLDYPQLHLIMLGEGSMKPVLKNSIKQLPIANRIHFLDPQPTSAKVLSASDIFLHTSDGESFGLAIVEAKAMGVPPIAFHVDAVPYVLGEAGRTVSFGDLSSMEKIIRELIKKPETRLGLAQKGQSRARGLFNLDSMVSQTRKTFQDIFQGLKST